MVQFLRGIVLISIIAVTLLLSWDGAKAQTLGSMMHDREKLQNYWRTDPPTSKGARVPNDADAATCYGYMLAFNGLRGLIVYPADCSKGFGPNCRHALPICIPDGVLFDQPLAIFIDYAHKHTAQWHEQAWAHYASALTAVFPCKGEYLESPK